MSLSWKEKNIPENAGRFMYSRLFLDEVCEMLLSIYISGSQTACRGQGSTLI
jgi:hypothetical protein